MKKLTKCLLIGFTGLMVCVGVSTIGDKETNNKVSKNSIVNTISVAEEVKNTDKIEIKEKEEFKYIDESTKELYVTEELKCVEDEISILMADNNIIGNVFISEFEDKVEVNINMFEEIKEMYKNASREEQELFTNSIEQASIEIAKLTATATEKNIILMFTNENNIVISSYNTEIENFCLMID